MKRQKRSFTAEFKREAAQLVLDEGYSILDANRSLDIGENPRKQVQNIE